MIRHYLLILTGLLLSALPGYSFDRDKETKMLYEKLAKSNSSQDSIQILYDLMDLEPRAKDFQLGKMLYGAAKRVKDYETQLDILRTFGNRTGMYSNPDSALNVMIKEAGTIPDSEVQRETVLFLQMCKVSSQAKRATEKETQEKMADLIALEPNANKLVENERLLRLFTIVEYLSNGVRGKVLEEYMGTLTDRVNKANFKLFAIRNLLLTETANINSAADNEEAAVKADKELLNVIQGLEKFYRNKGRKYRSYDPSRYVIYRRMLQNFEALTPQEIEHYYSEIQRLMQVDYDVKISEETTRRAEMYYAMATKQYARAIPILQDWIQKTNSLTRRRILLTWLVEAAEGAGNKDLEISAIKDLNKTLEARAEAKDAERYRELAIIAKVGDLQAEKEFLKYQNKQEEAHNLRRVMSFVMGGWVLFGLLIVGFIYLWARERRTVSRIHRFVNQLEQERDYLKRGVYSDYISENKDEESAGLRIDGKRIRKKNVVGMMIYILNDMLYISSIGKWTRKKFERICDATTIIEDVITEVKTYSTSQLELKFNRPAESTEVKIDKECLEYLLRHFIKDAERVSDQGTLIIDMHTERNGKYLEFCFTHTGVVVANGSEEIIFDNFISYDSLTDRKDAGLFISRLNDLLLHSSIRLDRECKTGTRYILTINTNMHH
ncbi:MAG: HAMP domain-containing histidine kinase [Bacteroidales bacterium]|nr:HAMP domain-containing histidine kinase [Bacteroidales bacterium]